MTPIDRRFADRAKWKTRIIAWILVLLPIGLASPMAEAAPAGQDVTGERLSYELVDRIQAEPWRLRAGHFASIADLSSAPDGRTYVLDVGHQALHILDADGRPLEVIGDPRFGPRARGIDVGPDGHPYLLRGELVGQAVREWVERLAPDGSLLERLDVTSTGNFSYQDIAVDTEGRVHLSRWSAVEYGDCEVIGPGPNPPRYLATGVDVFAADGRWLETYGEEHLAQAMRLDVLPDGSALVVNHNAMVRDCNPNPRPVPTATPRPSLAVAAGEFRFEPESDGPRGRAEASPMTDPGSSARIGVVRFDAAHDYDWTLPGEFGEVAAGDRGAFVGYRDGIWPLVGSSIGGRIQTAGLVRGLDLLFDGRLRGGLNSCRIQAIGEWPAGGGAARAYYGTTDAPPLRGPAYPLGLATGDELVVLEGSNRSGLMTKPHVNILDHQVIQRWSLHGGPDAPARPRSQMSACMQADNLQESSYYYPVLDIAAWPDAAFTVQPTRLERRPDDHLADRVWDYEGKSDDDGHAAHLTRVAARGDSLAVLNLGMSEVDFWEVRGRDAYTWDYGAGDHRNALPVDIAISPSEGSRPGRVFLADGGRNRVRVHDPRLAQELEWLVHDGPLATDTGPDGDLYLLGRGGWGLRYAPDGLLKAWWRMPDRELEREPRDIAVDAAGRVYVSWVRLGAEKDPEDVMRSIHEAGIWVFEPRSEPIAPERTPRIGRCLAETDKRAAPSSVDLGETVEVSLEILGSCPGEQEPVQVAILVDTSYSMSYRHSLERGQTAILGMLQSLEAGQAEVALATFGDGAALHVPLTADFGSLVGPLLALKADGDTRMAAGIDIATTELLGERGKRDQRQVLLVVTDGVPKDAPLEAFEAARAAGLETYGLVLPFEGFTPGHVRYLHELVGGPEHYLLDPEPDELNDFTRALSSYQPELGLFDEVTVEDIVPDNMDYVSGSAVPAALWEPDTRTLRWTLRDLAAADGLQLRYTLRPRQAGLWPTNVQADARFTDAKGQPGQLVFPVPEVEVLRPAAIFLPLLTRNGCRPETRPQDLILVIDASSSMQEPALGGGTKLDAVRRAAGRFVATLDLDLHRIGVVEFNDRARSLIGLSHERGDIERGLAELTIGTGTRIDRGLVEAHRMLLVQRRPAARPVVLLLTDGQQAGGFEADMQARAAELHRMGVLFFVVGLGTDVDHDRLRAVAGSPDRYFVSPDDRNLGAIYMQIALDVACTWP